MFDVTCLDAYGNVVTNLTQWDTDQSLIITDSDLTVAPEFHFCNKNSKEALKVSSAIKDEKITVKVPNILLQEGTTIIAYMYAYTSTTSGKTLTTIRIPVRPRPKPSDYQYVENIEYVSAVALEQSVARELQRLASDYENAISDINGRYIEAINDINDRYEETIDTIVVGAADGTPKGTFTSESDLTGLEAGIYINLTDTWLYFWDGTVLSEGICQYQTANTDISYNPLSSNAQSGRAVAEAIKEKANCNDVQKNTEALEYIKHYGKNVTPTDVSLFERDLEDGTWCITRYNGEDTDVVIPYEINGIAVTSIGANAFNGCDNLTSVVVPQSVTEIREGVFYDCYNLVSITLPDSVTSIGDGAFQVCMKLANITLGKGVTSIGNDAFYGCTQLISITIPNSVTSIGNNAFYNCIRLISVTIPDSVTSIGNNAFYNCIHLISVTIPDGVTSIGERAFAGCDSLTSITIPDSVTSIGNYAFYSCDSLKSVTIGKGVTSIGEYAFYYCIRLKNVTIPNSIESIGDGAFRGCNNLTVICNSGSYAETYCKEKNINYVFGTVSPDDLGGGGTGIDQDTLDMLDYILEMQSTYSSGTISTLIDELLTEQEKYIGGDSE